MSPSNISYLWNYGSLLGIVLVIQIATGVTLAMHYEFDADKSNFINIISLYAGNSQDLSTTFIQLVKNLRLL